MALLHLYLAQLECNGWAELFIVLLELCVVFSSISFLSKLGGWHLVFWALKLQIDLGLELKLDYLLQSMVAPLDFYIFNWISYWA